MPSISVQTFIAYMPCLIKSVRPSCRVCLPACPVRPTVCVSVCHGDRNWDRTLHRQNSKARLIKEQQRRKPVGKTKADERNEEAEN